MERLTERTRTGVAYAGIRTKFPGMNELNMADSLTVAARREVMERLAEYEDTGLAPDELAVIKRILEKDLVTAIQGVMENLPEMVQRFMESLTNEQAAKILQECLLES